MKSYNFFKLIDRKPSKVKKNRFKEEKIFIKTNNFIILFISKDLFFV